MANRIKKLLTIITTLVFLFTSTCVVFADVNENVETPSPENITNNGYYDEDYDYDWDEDYEEDWDEDWDEDYEEDWDEGWDEDYEGEHQWLYEEASIDVPTILDSTYTNKKKWHDYIIPSYSNTVIPFTAKHNGMVYLNAKAETIDGDEEWDSVDICFYKTYEDAVAHESYAVTEEEIGAGSEGDLWLGMKVVKGKTYYISIRSPETNDGDMDVSIRPYIYSNEDRELTQGSSKWIISSCVDDTSDWGDDTRSTVYFKIKPNRTGCMKVTLTDFDSNYEVDADITLTNSKKKALSTSVLYIEGDSAFDAYFGVKKGVTYYIKVNDGLSITDNSYGIKYSVSKAKDRSLAKKSKAKKLKRKAATTYSLFTASTSKSTDWYKFSVPSSRKTVIRFDLNKICSGNLKITIYRGSKKVGTKTYSNTKKDLIINTGSGLKAKPGTYYIKVEKSKKASGTYGIKFVK